MSVEVEGVQIADRLRGKQVRLLLAYLVLNRSRHVGRDELIGALWPHRPPRSEDAALRTLLSRLRSALEPAGLSGRNELILELPEPVWVDVEAAGVEVQRAVRALARGDMRAAWALAQVPLNITNRGLLAGEQATWLEPRRRELEDVRLQALEVVGRAALGMGGSQLASAERAARNLIEAVRYRESGYMLLMETLAAQGNVAEALRVFETLRTLLRDELGVNPSPEALAVHERLLNPTAHPGAPHASEGPETQASIELPPDVAPRASAPMVGRKRELRTLGRLWTAVREPDARDGASPRPGRIVVLAGDPGIGKTTLASELARRAHDEGALVLAGRASEENLAPYQPFLEALRHYFLNAPVDELRATPREYASELGRLVPELRRRVPDLPPPVIDEPETERYRLFEAVVGLLSAISARMPVLLVLDDLHWADRPTLLLLRHLARALEPRRLLILVAYRGAESGSDGFAGALADLRRERLITELEIGGLGEQETAELVRLRTGEMPSRSFVRALHEETEGNPLFIEEIVRHLTEAGIRAGEATARVLEEAGLPEGVKQVIARRLARLDARAIEWLRVAAVIGRDFDASLLESVLSLGEDEFLDALEEGIAAGLVLELTGGLGRYSFAHALIRETLYEGMSAARRARIHRRVGEALEASHRQSLPALALHFTRAAGPQNTEKAISYATRAGDQAMDVLAYEEAAEHYSRAIEVLERFEPQALQRRCELLVALGDATVRGGERGQARSVFQRAADLGERLGDSESLARAAIGASREYVQEPGVIDEELIAMLRRALAMTEGQRTLLRIRLLARLCGALYFSEERDQMGPLSQEALEIAEELDDPEARATAQTARRRALWDAPHLDQRLRASTEMLTQARRVGNLELQLQAHAWLVVDLLEHGDTGAVDAQIEAFADGAAKLRQPLYVWHSIVWRAMQALLAGRLEEAEQLASEALEAGGTAEAVTAPQYYAIQMLAIRREQCRMAELEEPARQLVHGNPARPAWRAALANLLVASGKRDEAAAEIDAIARRDFSDIPPDGDWMTAVTLLSETVAELGDAPRAASLREMLLPYARTNVVIGLAAVCLGSSGKFLGSLAATMGREQEGVEHFERALERNGQLGSPVLLAHTQLDLARVLGPCARSAELVDAASRTADQLQLPLIEARAEALRGSRRTVRSA